MPAPVSCLKVIRFVDSVYEKSLEDRSKKSQNFVFRGTTQELLGRKSFMKKLLPWTKVQFIGFQVAYFQPWTDIDNCLLIRATLVCSGGVLWT